MRLNKRLIMRFRTPTLALGLATWMAAGMAASGCNRGNEDTNKPIPETERPRRAAMAFVRCVESSGSSCVEASDQLGAWDAFSTLGWLAGGSPLSILRNLQRELTQHSDRNLVLKRFAADTKRFSQPLRGAECTPVKVIKLDPLLEMLEEKAAARLQNVGIWSGDLERVIKGLAEESRGLNGGYITQLECQRDPYVFYVATAVDGERQFAVGVMATLPQFLGGSDPDRRSLDESRRGVALEGNVAAIDEVIVDTWIPIAPEVF